MVEQRFCKPKVAGSIPASGTRIRQSGGLPNSGAPAAKTESPTYPQSYAPIHPRISLARAFLGLANRLRCCSNNQVVAVLGSKRRGSRVGTWRAKERNHGAPDTSVSGAFHFPAPRHPLAGPFLCLANVGAIFLQGAGTALRLRRYTFVVHLFGGESWSPGYFGNRGLLVSALERPRLHARQFDPRRPIVQRIFVAVGTIEQHDPLVLPDQPALQRQSPARQHRAALGT